MDWGNWEIIGLGLTSTQAGRGVVIALPDYSFHACGLCQFGSVSQIDSARC